MPAVGQPGSGSDANKDSRNPEPQRYALHAGREIARDGRRAAFHYNPLRLLKSNQPQRLLGDATDNAFGDFRDRPLS